MHQQPGVRGSQALRSKGDDGRHGRLQPAAVPLAALHRHVQVSLRRRPEHPGVLLRRDVDNSVEVPPALWGPARLPVAQRNAGVAQRIAGWCDVVVAPHKSRGQRLGLALPPRRHNSLHRLGASVA